ncbi:MAG: hypothetical protein AB7F78_25250 [Hyphomicrobiaceae bacterium]
MFGDTASHLHAHCAGKAHDGDVRICLETNYDKVLALLARFGVEPPRDTWPERVRAPRTLEAACRAGVEAEIENEAMYERLLRQIGDPAARRVLPGEALQPALRRLP